MDDETDETIARIAAALRHMPVVDPARKASVLVAVAAERERAREARVRAARRWRVAGAMGVAAAAGLVLTVWWRDVSAGRRAVHAPPPAQMAAAPTSASAAHSAPSTTVPSATTHLTGNQLIELDGDSAHLETYLLTVQWTTPGPSHTEPPGAVSGVRYQDDVVRTDKGWRIARRTVDLDWTTGWPRND